MNDEVRKEIYWAPRWARCTMPSCACGSITPPPIDGAQAVSVDRHIFPATTVPFDAELLGPRPGFGRRFTGWEGEL